MFETILNKIWAVATLLGIALVIWSLFYRTEAHPGTPSFSPRDWRPIWKTRSWYTPMGYKLHILGWSIFGLGAVISLYRLIAT